MKGFFPLLLYLLLFLNKSGSQKGTIGTDHSCFSSTIKQAFAFSKRQEVALLLLKQYVPAIYRFY